MRIAIETIKTSWQGPSFEMLELECEGSGTKIDPAIIEPTENLPRILRIHNSDLFITIKNCDLPRIWLISCQNINVENCKVRTIIITSCSRVFIARTKIYKSLRLYFCTDVKIEDCTMKKLIVYQSNSNIIKNCIIAKIKSTSSNDNIYESISIPEDKLKKLEKTHFADRIKLKSLVVFLILFFAVVILLPKLAFNTFMELPMIFILLGVFVFLFYLLDIIKSTK